MSAARSAVAESSAIYRVATAFEADKRTRTVVPDAAEATRALGRDRFYDAFAGRYGLPGSALRQSEDMAAAAMATEDTPVASLPQAARFDLSSMTVDQVVELADVLRHAGSLTQGASDLLAYRLDGAGYKDDSVFARSPVAEFARTMSQRGQRASRTVDLIAQQEAQLRYLTENHADPRAIDGARAVLSQLRKLQVEQTLYSQIDTSRDRDDGGVGPFAASTDLISLPSSALSMFAVPV